jgi:hypothetical protein
LRNENEEPTVPTGRGRGRPRRWADDRSKYQQHRARAATQRRLVGELLEAARAARWSDALHVRIHFGEDEEVLQTLIEHYQSRHWSRTPKPGVEEGGSS